MGVPYGIEVSCSHFDFALWPFLFCRRLLGVGHMIVKIVANRIEAGPTGSMPSQGGRFLFHQISWVSRCAIPGGSLGPPHKLNGNGEHLRKSTKVNEI